MSRRGHLRLFLLLGLLAAACAWPMDRYGANRAGHNPFEQIIGVENVADLVPSYTAPMGPYVPTSPVVVNDVVYVADEAGQFYAFSSLGDANCAGVPKTCLPLWTAYLGDASPSTAAVGFETVYVGGDRLYAFSTTGAANCAGVPKVCEPLWTAWTGGGTSAPLVAEGVVYVGSGDRLLAFDANGQQGCSGTPRTCQPLWTAQTAAGAESTRAPAYADGVVYVTSDLTLLAFDATGVTNCTGTPRTCEPLWMSSVPCSLGLCRFTSPAVSGGRVFVGSDESDERIGSGSLRVFAADGGENCADPVRGCQPLWQASTMTQFGAPSVADGIVYVNGYAYSDETFESLSLVEAWDADGTGCNGCWLWTGTLVNPVRGSTSVANGVVYMAELAGKLSAYDATGTVGCTGVPGRCEPLWTTELGTFVSSSPTIANGRVYVAANGGLRVFALPGYA